MVPNIKHKKLMQLMVPNKLFRVAEFAWKLGYSVCNLLFLILIPVALFLT